MRAERSKAFGRFCERVYEEPDAVRTADMEQLEKLIAILGLNERAVSVAVSAPAPEYISDLTGKDHRY